MTCSYTFEPSNTNKTTVEDKWSCPHKAVDGTDMCLFHLTPDERNKYNINDKEVSRKLKIQSEKEGPKSKRFIGAYLGDIDLSHLVIDAPDRHPIDLRHSTIEGVLDFSHSKISQPLDLRDTEFETLLWIETEMTCGIELSKSVCQGELRATSMVIDGDLDARDMDFEATVILDEACFHGDACFRNATFCESVQCRGVEFNGDANLLNDDACFEQAVFKSDVAFTKGKFRYADFIKTKFGGSANFEEVTFTGDAEFIAASFEGEAIFRGAEFQGDCDVRIKDADFSEAMFSGRADFNKAEFRSASFEKVRFEESAHFEDNIFHGEVKFSETLFEEMVTFVEARFYNDAAFNDTEFHSTISLRGAEFHGGDNSDDEDLTFEGALIGGVLNCDQTEFNYTKFVDAKFKSEVTFHEAIFNQEAIFTNANFQADAHFKESRFNSDTDFAHCEFDVGAVFIGAEFSGGNYVEDDDLTFEHAKFGGRAEFNSCRFRFLNFSNVICNGEVDFSNAQFNLDATFKNTRWEDMMALNEARFEGKVSFKNCRFGGQAKFKEVRFNDDASFIKTEFEAAAHFEGSEFHGGANLIEDDAAFDDAKFHDDVSFMKSEFGYVDFSGVTFELESKFENALFTDEANFTNISTGGLADFDRVEFEEAVTFENANFGHRVRFDQTRFCDEANFVNAYFSNEAEFTATAFEGDETDLSDDANFKNTEFDSSAIFNNSKFRYANFINANFKDVSFDHVTFEKGAAYDKAQVNGEFSLCYSQVMGDASAEEVTFEQKATFCGTAFEGGPNVETWAVTFDMSDFQGTVSFEQCEFQTASLVEAKFGDKLSFESAVFENELILQAAPKNDCLLVSMNQAVLNEGKISQPTEGATFYDMSGTTIREISFKSSDNCQYELLDYFLFIETDFDGFDFSKHMRQLSRNNWIIHEFFYHDCTDDPNENITRPAELPPAVLERTYLLAKNSANEFGHRKAAAEFYIKEFTYRRKKNRATVLNSVEDETRKTGVKNRLFAGGRWFGNWLLYETCGYGERIWRILYVSTLVIVSWALLYLTVTEGTRGPGDVTTTGVTNMSELFTPEGITSIGHTLYFSLVTFTTLGYGDVQPIGTTARLLASIESFLGALLLALVVFVIGRRMA